MSSTNRLPITLSRNEETGAYTASKSTGGLVTGLSAVRGFDMVWIGWPGMEIPEEDREQVLGVCREYGCTPVFLSQLLIDLYYNGFANNVIWPLFHYILPPLPSKGLNDVTDEQWEAYQTANQMFVDAIMSVPQSSTA